MTRLDFYGLKSKLPSPEKAAFSSLRSSKTGKEWGHFSSYSFSFGLKPSPHPPSNPSSKYLSTEGSTSSDRQLLFCHYQLFSPLLQLRSGHRTKAPGNIPSSPPLLQPCFDNQLTGNIYDENLVAPPGGLTGSDIYWQRKRDRNRRTFCSITVPS
jgi:hypothetical protein